MSPRTMLPLGALVVAAFVVSAWMASRPVAVESTSTGTPSAEQADGGWVLIWADEFDGAEGSPPDPRWWTHETGGNGWGNRELQYYVDDVSAAAHDGEGHLVIIAAEGTPTDGGQCWYGACRFTSARITTQDKVEVEYGRIEFRAKLPEGDGMWPAFWMLGANMAMRGWPNAGEIDILEHIGKEPRNVYGTVHGPQYSGGESVGGRYRFPRGSGPADGFHDYALEWETDRLRWYVDGTHYSTVMPSLLPDPDKWVFDHPFFMILNLAVGGQWPGPPSEDTTFPQQLVVDHIRVYEAVGADG